MTWNWEGEDEKDIFIHLIINISVRCIFASLTNNFIAFILMPNSVWPGIKLFKKLRSSLYILYDSFCNVLLHGAT